MDQIKEDESLLQELADSFSTLEAKLPFELFRENEGLNFKSPENIQELLIKAKEILIPRLLAKGSEP
ncbi:MAG: hypothetical protein GY864_09135 [Desulfobacterales bacterium]|nr:hypothetical protein [Desulfobacterales bacterium]